MTANVYLFDGWEEEKMAKGNRCVERTCEMLRKAYGELAIEKDEEKITVQEVVDRSGLSRHALYDHYGSVDALARDVKENFEKRLNACIQQMAMAADKTDPLPLLEGLSQFIMDSEDQCKLLLKSPKYGVFMEKTKQAIVDGLCDYAVQTEKHSKEEALMLLHMLAGAAVELYTKFLQGELHCTLQQVNEKLAHIYHEQLK